MDEAAIIERLRALRREASEIKTATRVYWAYVVAYLGVLNTEQQLPIFPVFGQERHSCAG
jgi:hypothetical protein